MDILKDIAAVEKFAKAMECMDPAKVVDTALKFMSSTRSRIEAGERRIADLESKLGSALTTIDKLGSLFGGMGGIDLSAVETELAAMGTAAGTTKPLATSANDKVAAVVPDADPGHIDAAIAASDASGVAGGTLDDMKAAAVTAATDAGATNVHAQAIAAAIPILSGQGEGPAAASGATSADLPALAVPAVGLPGALPTSV